MNKRIFLFVAMLMSCGSLNAADAVDAKVVNVGVYGNGRLFIKTTAAIQEAGCPGSRVDVAPENIQIKNWLSMAMTASVSGRTLRIKTNGCYLGFPTLDDSDSSFIFIRNY